MTEDTGTSRPEQIEPDAGARKPGGWRRLPWLVLFVVVFEMVKNIVLLTALVQFILRVSVGAPNGRVAHFARGLGAYARELAEYLGYARDDKPFPFGDWPRVEGRDAG